MKNITQFLLALVCLLPPATAFAQLDELRLHTVTIGEAADSITPGEWYLVYNSRGGGGYWWDYGFSNDDSNVLYMSVNTSVVMDDMLATDAAEWIVRFIKVESSATYDEYYVQFGTGNYVWTGTGKSTPLETVSSLEEATTLYAYCINGNAGHFGFLTTEGGGWRVDNNGAGSTVVLYGQNEVTSTGGNNDFTLYPVYLSEETSELEAAILECEYAYSQYSPYLVIFERGATVGCCDAEAVAEFEEAIDTAKELLDSYYEDGGDNLDAEEVRGATEAVNGTYAAVMATFVRQAKVEDGYYFLTCGLVFYDSTNDSITKAIFSELQDEEDIIYAKWSTLERTAPFLWKITSSGDGEREYSVVNVATNSTFNNVASSTNVTMTVDGENLMVFDLNMEADFEGLACIRVSTQAADGSYYLHPASHSSGKGTSGYIVGWKNTEAPTVWNLEPVSDEEAQAIIDKYNEVDIPWTLTPANWGTLILPFDADVPEGLAAYSCAELGGDDGTTLQLVEAEDAIKANTPYIIKGGVEEDTEYSFTGTPKNTADAYTAGLLTGTFIDMGYNALVSAAGSNTVYLLQNHTEDDEDYSEEAGTGVAFYPVTAESTEATLTAYHCYLTVSGDINGVRAYIGFPGSGMETGIEAAESAEAGGDAIYDLSGRRVANAKKGVYIVNGRKALVK